MIPLLKLGATMTLIPLVLREILNQTISLAKVETTFSQQEDGDRRLPQEMIPLVEETTGEMMEETETSHLPGLRDPKKVMAEVEEEAEAGDQEDPRTVSNVGRRDTWLEIALTFQMKDPTEVVEENASNATRKVTLQESVLMCPTMEEEVSVEAEAVEEAEEEMVAGAERASSARRKATLLKIAQMTQQITDHSNAREEMMEVALKDGKMKETLEVEIK